VCRVETREEKKERRKREKAEQVAYKLEQVLYPFFSLRIFLNQLNQSLVIFASTVFVAYIFAHRILSIYCTYSISLFTFICYLLFNSFDLNISASSKFLQCVDHLAVSRTSFGSVHLDEPFAPYQSCSVL
jgi:hypothetical protein